MSDTQKKIKFTHIYVQLVLWQHRHLFILYSVNALTWSKDRLGSQQCILHYYFVNLQSYKHLQLTHHRAVCSGGFIWKMLRNKKNKLVFIFSSRLILQIFCFRDIYITEAKLYVFGFSP